MVLLRGVFWLGLVAAVVPYSKIDLPGATFAVDRAALAQRLASAPHFCRDNALICQKALALAGVIGAQSLTAVQLAEARLKQNR
jgi:hypothetical protein